MDAAHLRIAITTNSLVAVDANFASAKQMVFYDVTRDASEFVDVVKFNRFGKKGIGGGQGGADGRCVMDDMGDDDGAGHDPLVERVESLAGCSVVFTLGLSDLASVRIHNESVFPVKSAQLSLRLRRKPLFALQGARRIRGSFSGKLQVTSHIPNRNKRDNRNRNNRKGNRKRRSPNRGIRILLRRLRCRGLRQRASPNRRPSLDASTPAAAPPADPADLSNTAFAGNCRLIITGA